MKKIGGAAQDSTVSRDYSIEVYKLAEGGLGRKKKVNLGIKDGFIVLTDAVYKTRITENTQVESHDNSKLTLMLNTQKRASGRLVTFVDVDTNYPEIKDFKDNLDRFIRHNIQEFSKCDEVPVDCRWLNHSKQISICIKKSLNDGLGPVIIVQELKTEDNTNGKQYYKYLYELKEEDVQKDKNEPKLLMIKCGDKQKLLFDNEKYMNVLYTEIIDHIKTPPSLEEIIKIFIGDMKLNLNEDELKMYNETMTQLNQSQKSADKAEKALQALSIALFIAEFAVTAADSTSLSFIGLATLGFSVLMRSIAIKHETELEIKKAIEYINNLWLYIIEPLDTISKLEKEKENSKKPTNGNSNTLLQQDKMDKLIAKLNETKAILLKSI